MATIMKVLITSMPILVLIACSTNTTTASPSQETHSDVSSLETVQIETPVPAATPVSTETPVPAATPVSTETPVPTATPMSTETPVPTATATPVPSPSPTPLPSATPLPTQTPTPTVFEQISKRRIVYMRDGERLLEETARNTALYRAGRIPFYELCDDLREVIYLVIDFSDFVDNTIADNVDKMTTAEINHALAYQEELAGIIWAWAESNREEIAACGFD